jgi:thiamine pyrophosphate-dependent acetolactate synthase large subunit-like protein
VSDDPHRRLEALSEAKRALLAHERATHAATGHVRVARVLRERGVSIVYGVPGVPVNATFGACALEGLRLIGTRHQQAAVLMAAAHNYVAGRPAAVALVSSGAAASNALTGVVVANENAWPLVVLAGAVPAEPPDYGYFTQLDAATLFRPVTKLAVTAGRTSEIAPLIREAFAVAMRGRPGPVVVQLPADVLDGFASASCPPIQAEAADEIDPQSIDAAARLLAAARRPLLLLGKGARWNDAYLDVRALIETLDLPFVTSPMARGLVPEDHLRCYNAVAWNALGHADVVLMLGARLDWTFRHGASIAADASLIQVDIHSEELGRNRTATVAIHGDLRVFVRALLGKFAGGSAACYRRDDSWTDDLDRARSDVTRKQELEATQTARRPLAPLHLARALARTLPADALTVLDGNLTLAECQRRMPVRDAVCRLTPGNSGCMGVGIPFAIGAKLASPRRPVIAVCGDFAFGLNAFELETAVRHRIAIIVVISNNDGNAGALREQEMFPNGHPERVSMYSPGIRYDALMHTFGGFAAHVEAFEALEPTLLQALAAGGPACINVALDPHARFPRT